MPDYFIGYAIDVVTLSLITWIFIRIRPRADTPDYDIPDHDIDSVNLDTVIGDH